MKTGIQVSSLKPVLTNEQQVRTAFEKMARMGCKYVQLQWIDPSVPIEGIAGCMEEFGIQSVSVQDFYEIIRQNPSYYLTLNQRTGGTWMCISRIPERLKSKEGLKEYVRELKSFQQLVHSWGQKLCLHPVSADFAPIEGIRPVEYLLQELPDMDFCMDLYHLNRLGYSMPQWLYDYQGRVCMVHFKEGKQTPAGDVLVPAGQGDTDWTGVVKACLETKVPYGFVEQESWDRDPFVCLEEALTWLNGEIKNAVSK